MSIDIELALVLGLFMIGAVVLAVDNLVNVLHRRLIRWLRQRKSMPTEGQTPHPAQEKNSNRL